MTHYSDYPKLDLSPLAPDRLALRPERHGLPRPCQSFYRWNPPRGRLSSKRRPVRPALHRFPPRLRVPSDSRRVAGRPLWPAPRPRGRSHLVGNFHRPYRRRTHRLRNPLLFPPLGPLPSRCWRSSHVSLLESVRRPLDSHPRTRARQWADLRRSWRRFRRFAFSGHLHHDALRLAYFLLDLRRHWFCRGTCLVPRVS